ncbi:MAG: hypothetical protein KF832_17015 [Caldilineaceae bacterium]|nr:hypothetical protein [Caldilineaceae bacterium]
MTKELSIATKQRHTSRRTFPEVVGEFIKTSAAEWRMSPSIMVIILLTPFLLLVTGVVSALFGKAAYLWFTGEDGFAENLQQLFNALALAWAALIMHRYWRTGERLIAGLYLLLCVGLIFLIGEEISWGQRIFGWETQGVMAEINTQNETNIHNLVGAKTAFKWIQLLVGAYGLLPLVLPLARVPLRWQRLYMAIIPPLALLPYFGLLFVWKLYRNFIPAPAHWEFRLAEYNEVLELILAIGLWLFMVFQLRRERAKNL